MPRVAPIAAVLAMLAGTLVFGAGVASAHALCGETSPARNATLDRPPPEVWCEFSEPPTPNSSIEVYDGCEQRVDNGRSLVVGFRITVGVEAEDPGTYTVVWKTVSAKDGHPAFDSHTFTVRGESPCAPPTQGQGSGGGGGSTGGSSDGGNSGEGSGSGGGEGPRTGGASPPPGGGSTPPPGDDRGIETPDGDGGGPSEPGTIPGTGGVVIGIPARPSVGWPLVALLAVVLPFGLIPMRARRSGNQ